MTATASIPWRRGLAWLLFLGPFFFLSYGFANHVAAERDVSDTLLFEWERGIPFIPWTIIPYWSIDLLYGLSFLLCRDKQQVDRHALRLLTTQIVSVSCFLLFPLHFSFERPAVDGFFGAMFDALMGFDKPYNQAPSLHIGLLVIIWARFAAATPRSYRWLVHAWTALIALSVLTTYQHHFVDIPTGALVGFLCLWLWPDSGRPPLADWLPARVSDRRRLAIDLPPEVAEHGEGEPHHQPEDDPESLVTHRTILSVVIKPRASAPLRTQNIITCAYRLIPQKKGRHSARSATLVAVIIRVKPSRTPAHSSCMAQGCSESQAGRPKAQSRRSALSSPSKMTSTSRMGRCPASAWSWKPPPQPFLDSTNPALRN